MNNLVIRQFTQSDMAALGELYELVSAGGDVLFWWVGEESNWANVFCAFEGEQMVAKGQLQVFNVVPPGRAAGSKHKIFVNLKLRPGREKDTELRDSVYALLLERAHVLKSTLPPEYETILCTGNYAAEESCHAYFADHLGYLPDSSLYTLHRNLLEPIHAAELAEGLEFADEPLDTPEQRAAYLELEAEIWPDNPLGMERLLEYQEHPLWTSMAVRDGGQVAGSLMVWQDDQKGIIEDVFVQNAWRRRGIAKALLSRALLYLKQHGLEQAELVVLTDNDSALALYKSAGFRTGRQEIRYHMVLE